MTDLTPQDRERFAEVADVIIPPGEDMPSASQAGVPGEGIDRVLRHRPDLRDVIDMTLTWAPADIRPRLQTMEVSDPSRFAALLEAVSAAYFLDEDVSQRLGYRRREEVAIVFDEDLDDLVTTVRSRGQAYRDAGGDGGV
jgi:hypothetical protein